MIDICSSFVSLIQHKKSLKCFIHFILLNAFLSLYKIFMKINKSELLAKRGKHVGPKSKVAICLWGACQQFRHIALPTAPLWSRHRCSSNVPPRMKAGDRSSGWRLMQSQLTESFDVNRGDRQLHTVTSFWLGLILLFGDTPCRKWLLEINVPVLYMNQSPYS